MRNDIDEMMECAIRGKGLLEDMAGMDSAMRRRGKFRMTAYICSAAACLVAAIGIDMKMSGLARTAGYTFEPGAGQMGGSEITALMQRKDISAAMVKIDSARVELNARLAEPASDDPEYLVQLNDDMQELDLLEAVCRMRKGQYLKARKMLRKIADAEGTWADEAARLLKSL